MSKFKIGDWVRFADKDVEWSPNDIRDMPEGLREVVFVVSEFSQGDVFILPHDLFSGLFAVELGGMYPYRHMKYKGTDVYNFYWPEELDLVESFDES